MEKSVLDYAKKYEQFAQGSESRKVKAMNIYAQMASDFDFAKAENKSFAYKVANAVLGIPKTDHNATVWNAMKAFLGNAKPKAQKPKEKPQPQPKPKAKSGEVFHESFDEFLTILKTRKEHSNCLYLHGPAGTGKSHLVEQLAKALGLQFSCMNSCTDVYDLKGFRNASGEFMKTDFFRCFTEGGLFFLDEMDNSIAQALTAINGALANHELTFGDGKMYREHPNFIFVGAGNTVGRGGGVEYIREVLDESTLDRFFFGETNYDRRIEMHIAKNASSPTELVDFVDEIRKTAKECEIRLLVTYRAIKGISSLEGSLGINKAVHYGINKGLSKEDLRNLGENCKCKSNRYLNAFKTLYA